MNDTPEAVTHPLEKVYTTRRDNLRLLVDEHGTGDLGRRLGYSNGSYISQLLANDRVLTENAARTFEQKLGLAFGWFDMQRAG